MTRLWKSVLLAPLVPVLANAQEAPVTTGSSATIWFIALVGVAVVAVVFWRMQTMKGRKGPHGPQSPTPRGP